MRDAGLPLLLRVADRPVILLGDGPAAEAKRRILERAGARVVGEADDMARIAVVAVAEERAAQDAVARLKARGILVNAVDRPALCDFTLPAVIDRSPVLIAISTGGVSAGLAAALRQRLEAILPQSLGRLAVALGQARAAIRARWPDGAVRRRALGEALSEGGRLDPVAVHEENVVAQWLASSETLEQADRMEHIRLRSDDPDDLTLREARWLAQADRVYYAVDVPSLILNRARADAGRILCDTPPTRLEPGLSVMVKGV
ncbi:hypothetical protein GCM10023219_13200 [Stakelama sediminis]|uniref:precorrin-2 dehydrogenase n=1 Tax=Stakelama sediminis TaxID=463200 RepID=A0A840YWY3_9SPHN|nr:bifunctional precorrin-2 dehydrogenase/sirohydrochlorin ferrochelatase [Stakelama sediminis]MBB5718046.1 uroporphyrin-III C-methyltransferase/precorrin-2 dehydrogenase/sirohydrochlorin ferrochelatase [Stakelama sediminis]